jgi:tetratricopeptide (TPR) repeat protein
VVKLFSWDWEGARPELERGIQVNPGTNGHTPYGYYLYTMGRWDEAFRELKYTSDLNPGWQLAACDYWWALYASRRYDEAAQQTQQATRLDPNDICAQWIVGQVQIQKRMYKEAIATFQAARQIDREDLKVLGDLGYAYAVSGEKDKALKIIAELQQSRASLALYLIGEIYAGLGNRDQAFAWLDKAYEARFHFFVTSSNTTVR